MQTSKMVFIQSFIYSTNIYQMPTVCQELSQNNKVLVDKDESYRLWEGYQCQAVGWLSGWGHKVRWQPGGRGGFPWRELMFI